MTRMVPVVIKRSAVAARLRKLFYDIRNMQLEKLIFTATTGRSGTTTISAIFKAVPHCQSFHEPYPALGEEWLRMASYGETEAVDRYYHHTKSIYIRRSALGARYYFEANHLFVKTFIAPAIHDFGARLEVVHLVRPALEVAISIYRLREWPGTVAGNSWWLDHRAPTNRIKLAEVLETDAEFSHPFYRALWYWYETEARIAHWKEVFPDTRFHHFKTQWLNDRGRVLELLRSLGVSCDESIVSSAIGVKTNDIEERNGKDIFELDLARTMHERFQEMLRNCGYLRESQGETS